MINRNQRITRYRLVKIDVLVAIAFAMYVLSSYMGISPSLRNYFGRPSLYIFLSLTIVKLFGTLSSIRISSYSKWYFLFSMLCIFSSLYARDETVVFAAAFQLLINLIITFSVIQFATNYSRIKNVLLFYVYSALTLAVYLFFSGKIYTDGSRLGQELFGNPNILAMYLMISLICIFWLLFYGEHKFKPLYFLISIILLIVTALTGGRKFLISPVVFIFILIVLRNYKTDKVYGFLTIISLLFIVFIGISALLNVPALYNIIGVRYEGLINFLVGDVANSDSSTIMRYLMVTQGWSWFLERPILGYGLDNFRVLFSRVMVDSYSHNNYIEILVNLGMIGFILYYSFYAYLIKKLIMIKTDSSGLRNYFLAFSISLLFFEMGAVTYSLTQIQIFLGLTAAYVGLNNRKSKVLLK